MYHDNEAELTGADNRTDNKWSSNYLLVFNSVVLRGCNGRGDHGSLAYSFINDVQ